MNYSTEFKWYLIIFFRDFFTYSSRKFRSWCTLYGSIWCVFTMNAILSFISFRSIIKKISKLQLSMLLYRVFWTQRNSKKNPALFLEKICKPFKIFFRQNNHVTNTPYCSVWYNKNWLRQILNIKVFLTSSCEKWISCCLVII